MYTRPGRNICGKREPSFINRPPKKRGVYTFWEYKNPLLWVHTHKRAILFKVFRTRTQDIQNTCVCVYVDSSCMEPPPLHTDEYVVEVCCTDECLGSQLIKCILPQYGGMYATTYLVGNTNTTGGVCITSQCTHHLVVCVSFWYLKVH